MELTDTLDILPTLVELAGAKLPTDRPIDGHSYAVSCAAKTDTTRDWIFAFQADRRILRTKRWLLEDNSPLHWGHLFDCGDRRDGTGYQDVTESTAPQCRNQSPVQYAAGISTGARAQRRSDPTSPRAASDLRAARQGSVKHGWRVRIGEALFGQEKERPARFAPGRPSLVAASRLATRPSEPGWCSRERPDVE